MGHRNVCHSIVELMEWDNFSHCKFTMECWVCNGISSFISKVGESLTNLVHMIFLIKHIHVLSTEKMTPSIATNIPIYILRDSLPNTTCQKQIQ